MIRLEEIRNRFNAEETEWFLDEIGYLLSLIDKQAAVVKAARDFIDRRFLDRDGAENVLYDALEELEREK